MAMWCDIKGFYENENGKLKINHDDVSAFTNFVFFYLNPIKTKADFNFALKILVEAFECAMREKAYELDSESNETGIWLELSGMEEFLHTDLNRSVSK